MTMFTMYKLNASIGTSVAESTWTYAPLSAGIDNLTEALNEVVQQYQFFANQGHAVNHVTGMAPTVTCTGKRIMGDAAQDYIMARKYKLGKERQSSFKLTWEDEAAAEHSLTVACTICNIQEWAGAATDDSAISFEIRFDEKPTVA